MSEQTLTSKYLCFNQILGIFQAAVCDEYRHIDTIVAFHARNFMFYFRLNYITISMIIVINRE